MTVAPARTIGDVPPDYHGPIYYRLQAVRGRRPERMAQEFIRIEQEPRPKRIDDALGQRLATADRQEAALRAEPKLFDEQGNLRPEWRGPLKARMLSTAPKKWADFPGGGIAYVSERFHDVLEDVEPRRHIFIPLDVAGTDRPEFRMYVFFAGNAARRPVLAMRANGIEYKLSERGTPFYPRPQWLSDTSRFAYLNSEVIGDAQLFYDRQEGFIFSEKLVEAMGDILRPDIIFVALGVVSESLKSLHPSSVGAAA